MTNEKKYGSSTFGSSTFQIETEGNFVVAYLMLHNKDNKKVSIASMRREIFDHNPEYFEIFKQLCVDSLGLIHRIEGKKIISIEEVGPAH